MKTVILKKMVLREATSPFVSLEFPYDEELKKNVKAIPGAEWVPARRVWAIPCHDEVINDLLRLFKGKAWPDYSGFSKTAGNVGYATLPDLSPELANQISLFTDWMRIRRYSESTIKNYAGSLGLSFKFFHTRPKRFF